MTKLANYLVLTAVLGILAVGCSTGPDPIMSSGSDFPGGILSSAISIPPGATVQSATFYIHVSSGEGAQVDLHRITGPWSEGTVTWNNFMSAYDPTVIGSFMANASNVWRSVDVTALVQGWLDGTYDNYGLLLNQYDPQFTEYWSSEFATVTTRPKLEVCYDTPSGTVCEIIQRGTLGNVADSWISEYAPNANYGALNTLQTGLIGTLKKHTLLWFELPQMPEPAAIGDTVWYDEDEDGIQDAGEVGIPEVTVNLYNCAGILQGSMMTDANGFYMFTGLTPGSYRVEFIAPEGYIITAQNQGADDAVDSDADPATGLAECTTLDAGETDPTWDAGMYLRTFDGCTLTKGFWKRHSGVGPQPDVVTPLLPIWLGDAGGPKSMHVTTSSMAYDILQQQVYCDPSNGITKLYAQLLAAKLNIANGADGSAVSATIDKADDFLADHNCDDWDTLSDRKQRKVNKWKSTLDNYNNGFIGPGHCGDLNGTD